MMLACSLFIYWLGLLVLLSPLLLPCLPATYTYSPFIPSPSHTLHFCPLLSHQSHPHIYPSSLPLFFLPHLSSLITLYIPSLLHLFSPLPSSLHPLLPSSPSLLSSPLLPSSPLLSSPSLLSFPPLLPSSPSLLSFPPLLPSSPSLLSSLSLPPCVLFSISYTLNLLVLNECSTFM